jgi:hypothetical protein
VHDLPRRLDPGLDPIIVARRRYIATRVAPQNRKGAHLGRLSCTCSGEEDGGRRLLDAQRRTAFVVLFLADLTGRIATAEKLQRLVF